MNAPRRQNADQQANTKGDSYRLVGMTTNHLIGRFSSFERFFLQSATAFLGRPQRGAESRTGLFCAFTDVANCRLQQIFGVASDCFQIFHQSLTACAHNVPFVDLFSDLGLARSEFISKRI